MNRRHNRHSLRLAAGVLALALAGCGSRVDTQGYLPDADAVAQIQVGSDARRDVFDALGTPSSASSFSIDDSQTWYYIMRRTRTKSFFEQELVDQRVLAIEFGEAGIVREIRYYDREDGRDIDPVARTTPTRGRKLGFFEQLFGNIGRLGGYGPPQ